jgi:DNA-binding MarR family transcriptional regulator
MFTVKHINCGWEDKELDNSLARKLMRAIFQFKRLTGAGFVVGSPSNKNNINVSELVLLKAFEENSLESDTNVSLSEVRPFLAISKAAVSQMLGVLEKKGYINRDVDKSNRRNLIVTLTEKGHETLETAYDDFACKMERIIAYIGEDDAIHLISILERMSEALEKLQQED